MKKIISIFIFAIFSLSIFSAENKVIISVPDKWSSGLGFMKDLLKESYNDIGYEVIFSDLPLARSMTELINGRLDGELARSKDVAQKYNLVIVNPPYFTLKGYAYYLKGKFKKAPTIEEIKRGRISYIRGSFATEKFFIDAKSPILVNNEKQLLSLLNKDRVDFVSPVTSNFATGQNNLGKVLLFEISVHHILSIKNIELAKKLGPALKKNMTKKKYDHLHEQITKLVLEQSE
ncbi:transporter substrate-binding domain-containing protein [Bacteriovorax sp. PP10]|uniref:Transporter substrate-binding domain-containing protein n=1 Tax=Bacteriovorax antarcticus TaxID=3088717 RepID=A0ABU5VT17_9BACT|nr:transporter substrate-binding domain-containing protein [Bacteriovorax sp. PP10]MEA9355160.1 transporter substrate-binding domain-containing protein [Bacteriovorax sp. PP10]